MTQVTFTLLGVGTSCGVPRLGCACDVCRDCPIGSKNRRQRVAALLEVDGKKLLIDAGPDIRNQLLEHNIQKIDALYITHNHFDHIACIDDIKYAGNLKEGSIPLYANYPTMKDLEKRIGYLLKPVSKDFFAPFELMLVKKWGKIPFGSVEIQTLHYTQQNEGHSHPTEVMGFRVGDLAFLTDIKQTNLRLIQELKGVKTLIVGAVRDGESVAHFTFEEAYQFSKTVGAEKTIYIHLDHTVDYDAASKRLPGNVELGYDGYKIRV
ncbi:MAG: MBL fold metallo-hydrolase [Chlamydiia bacterium]